MNAPLKHSALEADAFRNTLSKFATGVCVVTAAGQDGPIGITINSFASVSMDPPLVLWSIKKDGGRRAAFEVAEFCAIHILHEGQSDLCKSFVKDAGAFEPGRYTIDANGVPVLTDVLARLDCKLNKTVDGGDHVIFLLEVQSVTNDAGRPLVFFDSGFCGVG